MQAPVSPEYYKTYLTFLTGEDLITQMKERLVKFKEIWSSIPTEKHDFAYAQGKWTIKQMLLHVCDAERIMAYRALCMARGEKNNLPGFDENAYAEASRYQHRQLEDVLKELELIRKANIKLVENFIPEDFKIVGNANGVGISVESIIGVIIGHEIHHSNILKERYLGSNE